ncbi:transferrin-binding protein-like solute binding protein [Novosphingobium sp. PY1]|uniref:transferrin-binding protein-like solute binding protein n=1 Tax=Novosphingobium sp. PY1 TaxID=1882221 RepID=UPI000BE77BA6|nr:transferrin-binding protein-like solute binding protein [Novosphingobium sp. PY1]BBA74130.1 hypothetical protein [Novosphingobium sp. PY1]GFM31367.1 uncharacterized protein PY1_contig-17-64 [Novosphingobium sp. PY1]
MKLRTSLVLAVAPVTLLAACGGGGSGGIASTPTPAPAPAQSPPADPEPPVAQFAPKPAQIFTAPLYNDNLAVLGQAWEHEALPNSSASLSNARNVREAGGFAVTYDATGGNYVMTAPIAGSGTVYQISDGGEFEPGASFAAVLADNAAEAAGKPGEMRIWPAGGSARDFSYVSFAEFYASAPAGASLETVAYGSMAIIQPTRPGEVPTTGSASYHGFLVGFFGGDPGGSWVEGRSRLDFDFAKGSLSGELTARMVCMMGCAYDDQLYTLADTHFARGATEFGGSLMTAGAPSAGTFAGMFAGPDASELAAQFQLPFFNQDFHKWVPVSGVIIGKGP